MTARIVDVQYHTLVEGLPTLGEPDNHQWMAVLKSVAAYEFYRRTYHTPHRPGAGRRAARAAPAASALASASASPCCSRRCAPSAARAPTPTPTRPSASPAGCTTTLKYDRIEDIFARGLHAVPGRGAAHLPRDRRAHGPHLLLLRGGRMNRVPPAPRHRVRVRRPGLGELQRGPPPAAATTSARAASASGCARSPASAPPAVARLLRQLGAPLQRRCAKHRRLRIEAESVVMAQEPPLDLRGGEHARRRSTASARRCSTTHYDFLVPVDLRAARSTTLGALVRAAEDASGGTAAGFARAAAALDPRRASATRRAPRTCTRRCATCSPLAPACARTSRTCCIALARTRGLPGTLRVRLPGAARRRASGGERRRGGDRRPGVARLGRGVRARRRLGRPRPDARRAGVGAARPRRLRPRLRRRRRRCAASTAVRRASACRSTCWCARRSTTTAASTCARAVEPLGARAGAGGAAPAAAAAVGSTPRRWQDDRRGRAHAPDLPGIPGVHGDSGYPGVGCPAASLYSRTCACASG